MREGVTKGLAPTLELLAIGARNPTRHPSDLLPYLPKTRPLFAKAITGIAETDFKVLQIALSDIESVTKTVVQVRGPVWHL